MPDPVLSALEAMSWPYADQDLGALRKLDTIISEVGKRESLIHYSDLARGVAFRLPNVDGGRPFELGVPDWREIDRAILGSFLGRLCVDSYAVGGFLASALVTSKETEMPSEGFWLLVEEIGMFRSRSPDKRTLFWTGQVAKAHDWYKSASGDNPRTVLRT